MAADAPALRVLAFLRWSVGRLAAPLGGVAMAAALLAVLLPWCC